MSSKCYAMIERLRMACVRVQLSRPDILLVESESVTADGIAEVYPGFAGARDLE
jgi:hypothetical protein